MRRFFVLTIFLFASSIKADNIECPPGAIRPQNIPLCYIFNSALKDFYGAESECNLQNGHLAYIDSAFTNAAIGTNATNLLWDQYWIGAHVVKQTMNDANVKIWVWTDSNMLVTYSDWYMDEPNQNNDCTVGKASDFTWQSANCGEKNPFVCSIPIKINFCEEGWTYFSKEKSCYKVIYGKSWDDAQLLCQSENAHLTSIHSDQENDFIVNLAKSGTPQNWGTFTWIGFRTYSVNTSDINSYKWIDGSKSDYFKWLPYQPDNDNEACVEIFSDKLVNVTGDLTGEWNNGGCDIRMRNSVCKKPANVIQ